VNSRLLLAGVRLTVGVTVGVSVGSMGPIGGSVAVAVGDGVGDDACVEVGLGNGVYVGLGVGVGTGAEGKATMTRLITMLPTISKLMPHSILSLRLRLRVLRLLTTMNLLTVCSGIIPQPAALA
jgi:hypothetical protein